ncbi:MAG: leucine-rich repeat domain-containing protein, partial [Bdellovibrionota bacterium]
MPFLYQKRCIPSALVLFAILLQACVQTDVCSRTKQVVAQIENITQKKCAEVGPEDLAKVTTIQVLNQPPEDFVLELKVGDFDGLGLISLSILNTSVESLPDGIFRNLEKLSQLQIIGNQLTQIQKGLFSDLKNLKTLNIQSNSITELSSDFFMGISELETFSISTNSLKELPEDLFQNVKKLRQIDLGSNALETLPFGSLLWIKPSKGA